MPLEQFQRLLVSVGLEPKWAGIARDWIDADDQPGRAGRRRGRGLHHAESPLPHRQLADDEPERAHEHARLRRGPLPKDRPYVTALPTATAQDQHLHGAAAGAARAWRTT